MVIIIVNDHKGKMMGHIDLAEAKNQLKRISEKLDEPLLLIGGIAVNQYYKTRKSQDIDLICEYEIATELVDSLYDTSIWDVDETNEDEYRPSYVIKHKTKDYPTIKIGPKIIERESYKYLDWDKLKDEASPFKYKKEKLNNILVPSIEALCYSKLVSFVGRIEEQDNKISQDLRDICELSNSDTFRLGVFLNMISSNSFERELKNSFSSRLNSINGNIGDSNLGKIINIFTKEVEQVDTILEPTHKNKILLQPRPKNVLSENKVRVAAFDLDGTLIKGLRHSWTMVWNHLKVDNDDQKMRKEAFRNNELSYLDWCKYDSDACKNIT